MVNLIHFGIYGQRKNCLRGKHYISDRSLLAFSVGLSSSEINKMDFVFIHEDTSKWNEICSSMIFDTRRNAISFYKIMKRAQDLKI